MKTKTTIKALRNNYHCLKLGYCALQQIAPAALVEPTAYTIGVYGWNFDAYIVGDIAICTGYRGMPGALVPSEVLAEYNARAAKLRAELCSASYTDAAQAFRALLAEFASAALAACRARKGGVQK